MAAKNRPLAGVNELLRLHVEASKHRDDLLEEVRQMRAAGKIREAKEAFKAAETIQKQLLALEKEFRPACQQTSDAMCYSALVRQDLHEIARRFGANVAYEMFAELFRRRLNGDDIKLSRALEQNFVNPTTDIERQIKADIDVYRSRRVSEWEKDLFVQKKRLADAKRSLLA